MQKYEHIKTLPPIAFKRLTRARKDTFTAMSSIVREAENKRMSRGGKPPHLGVEDRVVAWGNFKSFNIISCVLMRVDPYSFFHFDWISFS